MERPAAHPSAPEILFEDNHLIVVSKPPGLLSQGEHTGDPNLVEWARKHVGRKYVGLIHRLDRNVSGAMVLAKRTKAAQRLTLALQEGKISRTYLGLVVGNLQSRVKWVHSLVKDQKRNIVRVIENPNSTNPKTAIVSVVPVGKGQWLSQSLTWVEFHLETGRSHQIRVQAAHERFPLLGDPKYGKAIPSFTRPALHSFSIRFPHPMTGEEMHFIAPIPEDMKKIALIPLKDPTL